MTHDPESLERVVARTGHRRFRDLLDPAHPDFNPAYWATVRQLDGQPAPAPETRRGKPVLRLGTPQRPPEGCATCGGNPPAAPAAY